jgi:hypothetical protein
MLRAYRIRALATEGSAVAARKVVSAAKAGLKAVADLEKLFLVKQTPENSENNARAPENRT